MSSATPLYLDSFRRYDICEQQAWLGSNNLEAPLPPSRIHQKVFIRNKNETDHSSISVLVCVNISTDKSELILNEPEDLFTFG